MGCGCRGSSSTGEWVYVDQNGVETVKASEVEAKAMMIRNGGQGTVRAK